MDTRNITLIGVWAFAIIWLVGMLAVGGDMLIAFMLFFIAIAVSVAVNAMPMRSPEAKS